MSEENKVALKASVQIDEAKDDVKFILDHATVKGDTVTLSQGDTEKFFESQGVGRETLESVKKAVDKFDTAAVIAASSLLNHNVKAATKKGEDASKLRAKFTARNVAFSHEAVVTASKEVPAGAMKPGEKPERKTIYGHAKVGMEVRGKLNEGLKTKVAESTRKALGV